MIEDKIGEKTIFIAVLKNDPVLTIRKYDHLALINKDEEDPFLMSICYIGQHKHGMVFLLSEEGFIVSKKYQFSLKNNCYVLKEQTIKLDTVEPLFDQFEYDCYNSSILKSLDFDIVSFGKFISHEFLCLPEAPRKKDFDIFVQERDQLSYKEKLQQQRGRREDPIELVLITLHEWQSFVNYKNEKRHAQLLLSLDKKKKHKNNKRFSLLQDCITSEDLLMKAYEELNKIKNKLNQSLSKNELLKIKNDFDKVQEVLSKEEELLDLIDENIYQSLENVDPVEKDLGFIEFGEVRTTNDAR